MVDEKSRSFRKWCDENKETTHFISTCTGLLISVLALTLGIWNLILTRDSFDLARKSFDSATASNNRAERVFSLQIKPYIQAKPISAIISLPL